MYKYIQNKNPLIIFKKISLKSYCLLLKLFRKNDFLKNFKN